ncbi:MAG TPA: YceI family protein [Cyclobacteriaceae bacterium]
MIKQTLFFLFFCLPLISESQRYVSESSNIRFFSEALVEDIEATTTTSSSIIDLESGEFAFLVNIKDFQFRKSLMQEHFNESYLESDKYPHSTFKGKIENWDGNVNDEQVTATGALTIHGITHEVSVPANLKKENDKIHIETSFNVELKDYKIKIPKALFYNIAETIQVFVDFKYKPYEKG